MVLVSYLQIDDQFHLYALGPWITWSCPLYGKVSEYSIRSPVAPHLTKCGSNWWRKQFEWDLKNILNTSWKVFPSGIYTRVGCIGNRTSERSKRVRFLIQTDECMNSIPTDFPCCIMVNTRRFNFCYMTI